MLISENYLGVGNFTADPWSVWIVLAFLAQAT
jgi:hypothetical protein